MQLSANLTFCFWTPFALRETGVQTTAGPLVWKLRSLGWGNQKLEGGGLLSRIMQNKKPEESVSINITDTSHNGRSETRRYWLCIIRERKSRNSNYTVQASHFTGFSHNVRSKARNCSGMRTQNAKIVVI